jgi:hypothetical protein
MFMDCQFLRTLWLLVALLVACSCAAAQEAQLRKFLQNYATTNLDVPEVKATRYSHAFVHLRDDKAQQVIVYLMGTASCGTSGCTTLLLVPNRSSYRVVTNISIVQLPVRILDTKSHGWHDLGVWVQGGGIQPGYEARLSFDGEQYPENPTIPPAQPLPPKSKGRIVVPRTAIGEPLFPSHSEKADQGPG